MRLKKPAPRNIGLDLDGNVIKAWKGIVKLSEFEVVGQFESSNPTISSKLHT